MPDLSVIIVSWNVQHLLLQCLGSLEQERQTLDIQVIVVDSASSDGSADMVDKSFPWVTLIRQSKNVGFTRGNNLGLAKATGRYLLLLNPDTVVPAGTLSAMVDYMEHRPKVGVLGPQLRFPDGQIQSSRRRFPTAATFFFESTWLQPIAPRSILQRYYLLDQSDDAVSEVDWVVGACLMVRRQAYLDAGPMDEGYFMYSEEMEWQHRIKRAGWAVVYFPKASIIHHEGKSSEQVSVWRHIYFQSSKLRYVRQYHSPGVALGLRLFLLISYAWQLCLEAGKGLVGHKRPLRRQRVYTYWQVLRSGLRPADHSPPLEEAT